MRKTTIARKLIILFVFLSLIIATIGTTISLSRDFQNYKVQVKERFKQIEGTILPGLGAALFNEDDDQIKKSISGILNTKDMVYLEISRVYEGVLEKEPEFKKGKPQEINSISERLNIFFKEEGSEEKTEGEKVGEIFVIASLDSATEQIKERVKEFIVIQAIQFLFVTIIMFSLFKNLVSRHLVKMANYAENLNFQDLSGNILSLDRKRDSKEDELDTVANSLNKMKENLYDTHNKLKDYSTNLEGEVLKRTQDLGEALKNIEYLLNNMKQSIFTIDKETIIHGPVSEYSQEIFETKIEGKTIFETLFQSLDKTSEVYASIEFCFSCVFGTDELQWLLMVDLFPTRIALNEEHLKSKKTLKVTYTPLWDNNGGLDRIMFVIEDITELEKLEEAMKKQSEENTRNVEILQELALNKKEDLQIFFSGAINSSLELQDLGKKIRENLNNNKSFNKEIRKLFQILHSMKGNSRIFGLSLISTEVHKLENDVASFLNKNELISELDEETKDQEKQKVKSEDNEKLGNENENKNEKKINSLIQNLYGLHGNINSYLKAAKIVFGMVFKEDLDFKEKIHSSAMELEYLFAEIFGLNARAQSFKQIKKSLAQRPDKNSEIAEKIRKINHSIKGISRSLQEKNLSAQIHNFEGLFENLLNGEINDQDKFDETVQKSLFELRYEFEKVYLHTSFTKSYPFEINFWKEVLYKSFKLLKSFQSFEKNNSPFIVDLMELKSYWTGWHEQKKKHHTAVGQSDVILPIIVLIQNILDQKEDNQVKKIKPFLKDLWTFLCIISQIDYSRPSLDLEKTVVEENQALIDLFFRYFQEKGHTRVDFNETISDILQIDIDKVGTYLRSHYKLAHEMNAIYLELKKDISDPNIDKVIEVLYKKDDFTFFTLLKSFLKSEMMRWGIYTKKMAVLQYIENISILDEQEESQSKPTTIEILQDKIISLRSAITEAHSSPTEETLSFLEDSYENLFDVPVKYSFNKYKRVVQEISRSFGKKVKFTLGGDQGALKKEHLSLLNDSMIHLVRNALDHGLETPEERVSNGKDEIGQLEIICVQGESELEILIRDDGKGINLEGVLEKALEKGIIDHSKANSLDKDEVYALIFQPNFSTRKEVSEISGRGVGMDVVKQNLDQMKGVIKITSELGKGTEISLKIPIPKVG